MTGIVSNNNNSRTSGIIKPVAGGVSGMTSDGTDITITSGDLIIGTAGKGIDFSNQASPAAGMTSEQLDSYEEGTWTAAMDDGSSEHPLTMNASWETMFYTKVGNVVTISGWLKTTSLGSASGGLRVTGLPFTIADDNAAYFGGGAGAGSGLSIVQGESICFYGSKDQANLFINLWVDSGGSTGMNAAKWSDDGNCPINGTYRAA